MHWRNSLNDKNVKMSSTCIFLKINPYFFRVALKLHDEVCHKNKKNLREMWWKWSWTGELYVQRRRRRSTNGWRETVVGPGSAAPFHQLISQARAVGQKLQTEAVREGASRGQAGYLPRCWERSANRTGLQEDGGGGGGYPSLTHQGVTGNSLLLASWRGCLWSLVELLRIWWTPAVDAHPAPRWPPHYHTWLGGNKNSLLSKLW